MNTGSHVWDVCMGTGQGHGGRGAHAAQVCAQSPQGAWHQVPQSGSGNQVPLPLLAACAGLTTAQAPAATAIAAPQVVTRRPPIAAPPPSAQTAVAVAVFVAVAVAVAAVQASPRALRAVATAAPGAGAAGLRH